MKMYNFINPPKSISIDEYDKEIKLFLRDVEFIFNWNKFSLYLIWELGLPGVSDLDFLIILDDLSYKYIILKLAKKYKLIDTPLFVKYSDVNNLEYFTHHYNFKYIWWKELEDSLFIKNNKNLFLIYSWKVLFFSWLRNFYIPYFKKEIDIKKMLSWINDLRYPIFYLWKIVNLDEDILAFNKEYSVFRNSRFKNENNEQLSLFLEKAISISWKLIFILINNLNINKNLNVKFYWRFPTIFTNNINLTYCKISTEKYYNKISKIDRFLVLPNNMNYKNWNNNLKDDLNKIIIINKSFLNFGFIWIKLNILLFIKKMLDFIKLNFFEKYEKN